MALPGQLVGDGQLVAFLVLGHGICGPSRELLPHLQDCLSKGLPKRQQPLNYPARKRQALWGRGHIRTGTLTQHKQTAQGQGSRRLQGSSSPLPRQATV